MNASPGQNGYFEFRVHGRIRTGDPFPYQEDALPAGAKMVGFDLSNTISNAIHV